MNYSPHESTEHDSVLDERAAAPAAAGASRGSEAPIRGLAMILISVAVLLALWGVFTLIDSDDPNDTVVADPGSSSSAAPSPAPSSAAERPEGAEQAPPARPEGEKPARPADQGTAVDPKTVPVTTLNNSTITGLADSVATKLRDTGWNVREVGNFADTPLPETTVFFTPGNADEERAARALAEELGVQAQPRSEAVATAPQGVVLILTKDLRTP
ncbi:LytR C-terminal domain-containing protein [Corynebacterium sp. TAE3-ERU30]|uniref:LytR C-terminal domain-containing protein n=1 Tax=Corynebacterium sp. TAE3-ERU30 TaxID=2849496 RepID=UPI002105B74E|nr:LytR C-terminal domain-containing protein [Corynebacterium sp. TAE3-ERU30]